MQIESGLASTFIAACQRLPTVATRDLKSRSPIYFRKPEGTTFLIKRGYVRLAYADPSGRLWTRMLLGKGALFGELPFSPRLFVTAEQAVTSGMACVAEIRRAEMEAHAEKTPLFQSQLAQVLSFQVAALDRRLQWQLISPIRRRVTAALYDLLCFAGGRCGHGHLIDIRLTHEEFSELVVAARPVVSGVLADLKASKIIEYTRGHICLLSLDRLEAIAEESSEP